MHAPGAVLIGGRLLQCFLCRINNEAQIIAVSHDLDRGEWNCHFLFTDTEKSSDTDERSSDGAIGGQHFKTSIHNPSLRKRNSARCWNVPASWERTP